MDKMIEYYLMYVDGTRHTFKAKDDKAALWYVRMEGDHVIDWGRVDNG